MMSGGAPGGGPPHNRFVTCDWCRQGLEPLTNENTNGLLRQYLPKGTDLAVCSSEDLDRVAQELNDRPRKRLAFKKPIELIGDLLLR